MKGFRVGDLCEIVDSLHPEHIGAECVITGIGDDSIRKSHDCSIAINGFPSSHRTKEWSARFSELRKIDPDYDGLTTVSWSSCDWRPAKERVT